MRDLRDRCADKGDSQSEGWIDEGDDSSDSHFNDTAMIEAHDFPQKMWSERRRSGWEHTLASEP